MEEWLNYPLEDLLLFSRETYLRLFERYHLDIWPAHILAAALGLGMLRALLVGRTAQIQAVLTVLAVVWLWVAYGFHAQRFMQINWAAEGFAWAFAAQAGLMIVAAIWPGGLRANAEWPRWFGMALFAVALVLAPLAGLTLDRTWREVEFFALTPDTTALATLAAMVAIAGAWRWLLALIPLGWAAVATATALAMESPEAYLLGGVAAVAVLAMLAGAFARAEPVRA